MYQDGLLWIAQADNENKDKLCILPNMANRHGLVAGATGTGKTVTLKVLAEAFSDAGVPVFMSDVKGDVSGMSQAGEDNEGMQKRIQKFGLEDCFRYQGFPTSLWDIFGEKGMPLRTTVSEMGPTLLARLLELNDTQTDILTIIFKIADDNKLLLLDMKDLRKMLEYVSENVKELAEEYGMMSKQSIGAISRSLIALENQGADYFFGEPAINIGDWMRVSPEGKGYINLMDSTKLINYPELYATFMLWLLSDLYETMPEVGDCEKPKMVFFFDEAHLLFKDAPKVLLTKVEQVVKLIRSKGIGIYFCTQSPSDIPDEVLSQLGNRIQHALRAYTPADQKAIKAAAQSFRVNPNFDAQEVLTELGTGEALVSFLDEKGAPSVVEKAFILCPESRMGPVTEEERKAVITGDVYYTKYSEAIDRESAYEVLLKRFEDEKAAEEKAKEEAEKAKEEAAKAKEEEKKRKEQEKEEERKRREKEKEEERERREEEREERREREYRRHHKSAFEKGMDSAVTSISREVTKKLFRGIMDNLIK